MPTGTVTFLFTDLESSTRLWDEQPDAMRAALARHDVLLRDAVEAHRGHVVKSTGDGLHAVFATADDAVMAAIDGQRVLFAEPWEPVGPLRVRMGLHTGVAEERGGDYFGSVLNRAARLMAVAHPGQVLCTQATADLVRDTTPTSFGLVELGRHRLRDLARPEIVFQVTDPDMPVDFPPLRSLDAFPGNLPTERTPLIGRDRELTRLAELLEQHRLVTLTGVGGVGKTRLAVQLAADVLDRFHDGAWVVTLASIRDPELVPTTVAAALEIAERPGRPLTDTLCDAIGSRGLLVVLDNCEHLLDATARLADALLDACPALRIVATSREALGVEGEQSWPTPSLGLPALEADSDVEEVAAADAVTLFVERARAVRPDFELSAENAPSVRDICRRLDGIPLAIELAAARIGALGPTDILERIDQRFLLLTGGSRTAMERHQTLRAAVDWSYDLLDGRERELFDRLSVFAGGFTLEAACAVAADDDATDVEVLDLLGSLVAKSIVIAEGSGGSIRYSLLETMRQYARERLAGGDVAAIRDRHARYYDELEQRLAVRFFGPDQIAVQKERLRELDNRSAAFDWCVERGEPELALRLARFMGPTGGVSSEALRRLESALALAETLPARMRIEPQAEAAWIAAVAGEFTRAVELADDSIASAESAGVPPNAYAFAALSIAAFWQGDRARAIAAVERAVELARATREGQGVAVQDELFIRDSLGGPDARAAGILMQACFVLSQSGEHERAVALGEESVAAARRMGAPAALSQALYYLGLAYRATDLARAAQLLEESVRLPQLPGMSSAGNAWTHVAIGQLRSAAGDDAGALDEFAATVDVCRQFGERLALPSTLQGMARACRQLGRLEDATRLLAAVEWLAEELNLTGGATEADARARAAVRLRELLGDERFDAEWDAGRVLSFEEAMALARDVATRVGAEVARTPEPPDSSD